MFLWYIFFKVEIFEKLQEHRLFDEISQNGFVYNSQ